MKKSKTTMQKKINSLYIHIPFCTHICHYCDFTKLFYNKKFSEPYFEALFCELDSYHINIVDTIYVGGGTPTSLSIEELENLLRKISQYKSDACEFTVEANVENLTVEKLRLMKAYGVNRLSIGIESTNNKMLLAIGRKHTFEDAVKVVELAKQEGFSNINIDLIYGFPHQTLNDLKIDLENILKLNTEHISIYSLIVSEGTRFFNDKISEQNEDDSRIYYDEILRTLRANGYERYEVSNFARNGNYSKHNLTYWRDEEYYGIGLGASGYVNGVRYTNTKNLDKYLSKAFIDTKETISKKTELEDFLLCNLRLEQGFDKKTFKNRFGEEFESMFKDKLAELINNRLILINNDRIMLSDEGLITMDRILLKLL